MKLILKLTSYVITLSFFGAINASATNLRGYQPEALSLSEPLMLLKAGEEFEQSNIEIDTSVVENLVIRIQDKDEHAVEPHSHEAALVVKNSENPDQLIYLKSEFIDGVAEFTIPFGDGDGELSPTFNKYAFSKGEHKHLSKRLAPVVPLLFATVLSVSGLAKAGILDEASAHQKDFGLAGVLRDWSLLMVAFETGGELSSLLKTRGYDASSKLKPDLLAALGLFAGYVINSKVAGEGKYATNTMSLFFVAALGNQVAVALRTCNEAFLKSIKVDDENIAWMVPALTGAETLYLGGDGLLAVSKMFAEQSFPQVFFKTASSCLTATSVYQFRGATSVLASKALKHVLRYSDEDEIFLSENMPHLKGSHLYEILGESTTAVLAFFKSSIDFSRGATAASSNSVAQMFNGNGFEAAGFSTAFALGAFINGMIQNSEWISEVAKEYETEHLKKADIITMASLSAQGTALVGVGALVHTFAVPAVDSVAVGHLSTVAAAAVANGATAEIVSQSLTSGVAVSPPIASAMQVAAGAVGATPAKILAAVTAEVNKLNRVGSYRQHASTNIRNGAIIGGCVKFMMLLGNVIMHGYNYNLGGSEPETYEIKFGAEGKEDHRGTEL